jgi:hypothetical protein
MYGANSSDFEEVAGFDGVGAGVGVGVGVGFGWLAALAVVTETEELWDDEPAEVMAATEKEYLVLPVRPETV